MDPIQQQHPDLPSVQRRASLPVPPMAPHPPGHGSRAARGRRTPVLALAVAVLAVILSALALTVAGLAYLRADRATGGSAGTATAGADARREGSSGGATSPASGSPETAPQGGEQEGPAGSPGESALPTAQAGYVASSTGVEMRLTPNGSSRRDVDLDQPAVNATNGTEDVSFRLENDKPVLDFETMQVALGRTAADTPGDCARAIQVAAAPQRIQLSKDLVLCAVTDGQGAVGAASRPRMARLVVRSVTNDGVVVLDVSTWEIPR